MLLATDAMGTRFELVLCRGDRAESELRSAGEEALREIVELDAKLSRFRRDSVVSFLQREAVHRAVPLEPDLFELFTECEAIRVASGGLFDIGVGASMERWGFHQTGPGDELSSLPTAPEPPEHFDADGLSWPAGASYRLDAETRTIQLRPGVRLDLGGVAKGFALDRAALTLRALGIDCALLHGGTSAIVAIGAPPDRAAWSIRLALPGTAETSGAQRPASDPPIIDLHNAALAVSTPLGRVVDPHLPGIDGLRSHIVDPRSGEPRRTECLPLLVAITGPRCAVCDAWTKPALLSGRRPPGLHSGYQCVAVISRSTEES